MNEKTIKRLIKLVEESRVDQLEVSSWGRKVKITRRLPAESNGHSDQQAITIAAAAAPPVTAPMPQPTPSVESPASDADKDYIEIKSPMVGTFYAAPAPDTPPYVTLGDSITVGQVICIVEAMKLMNEIESEVTGRLVKVMAENAQPVEFGQVLFLIDPKG
ncbi:MAG: acetyl-CoA carboxylase biotin carboxyl carrier protein [Candidatus Zixiibacteriota bacterium]|nr:MAG: acetyl-CoA carboxylase biotin carboxyl carrier protein [candidate division Zixibacteria bacterium]